jgi:hypothetical protein
MHSFPGTLLKPVLTILLTVFLSNLLFAQDNYEIQVYGAPTQEKGTTMFELHSNFTFKGSTETNNGVYPTNHVFHETLEITNGFTKNFEIGFYFFNAIGDNGRTGYVGSHIRPRLTAPEEWKLPIGLSLSVEIGYQKPQYCEDDWTLEIRPIIDKTIGRWYFCFNPVFDQSLHGYNKDVGFIFSPNIKTSYNITKEVAAGLEYYGSFGPLNHFLPSNQQDHQLFAVIDLDLDPRWEFNLGYGMGFNQLSDRSIIKMILGRKADWHKAHVNKMLPGHP